MASEVLEIAMPKQCERLIREFDVDDYRFSLLLRNARLDNLLRDVKARKEVMKSPLDVMLPADIAYMMAERYRQDVINFAIERGKDENPRLDTHARLRRGFESMMQNYRLLSPESADDTRASLCTVTVPSTLADGEAAINTVSLIRDSIVGGQPVEVIVWFNTTYQDDALTDHMQEQVRYRELADALRQMNDEKLMVRTAFQRMPKSEFNMGRLRANYMDAVAIDGIEKGRGFFYPVIWLDADTTHISKGAVEDIAKHVDAGSVLTHGNLQFSIDWAEGRVLTELDDATKAVALNEIQRRQFHRLTEGRAFGQYHEESGLGFAVGMYAGIGGVDRKSTAGESGSLIERTFSNFSGSRGSWSIGIYSVDRRIETIERQLQSGIYHDSLLNKVRYRPRAHIGTSARRHREVVSLRGVGALPGVNTTSYGLDGLYSELGESSYPLQPVLRKGVKAFVGENEGNLLRTLRSNNFPVDPVKISTAFITNRRIVDRYWPQASEDIQTRGDTR